ncbi:hypothetical protein HAX54_023830, partial [Datura stramonium]|nr:hypothetical protein [Datura stramonium]
TKDRKPPHWVRGTEPGLRDVLRATLRLYTEVPISSKPARWPPCHVDVIRPTGSLKKPGRTGQNPSLLTPKSANWPHFSPILRDKTPIPPSPLSVPRRRINKSSSLLQN